MPQPNAIALIGSRQPSLVSLSYLPIYKRLIYINMKLWGAALYLSSWAVPPPPVNNVLATTSVVSVSTVAAPQQSSILQDGISSWLVAAVEPSKADVQLLRQAFAEFYGVNRDLLKSESLLTQAVDLWAQQADDERAALYRVRGDCYTLMADAPKAIADYDKAIQLLNTADGKAKADPSELPAALLGRARAVKAQGVTPETAKKAAADYEKYLKLVSREEWDTDQELLEDGATRNPFAAWE